MSGFYSNHVFSKLDLYQITIKWHEWLWLWIFPTFVQIADNYAFHYKRTSRKYYLVKIELLTPHGTKGLGL